MKSDNSLEFKEGIRYIEDILKEVAKEQGLSEKEVREIWKIHKKYIKQCMNDPNITVINIPYVGLL